MIMNNNAHESASIADNVRHESKEVTKRYRPNESFENLLKGSEDEDLKDKISERFEICRVNIE